MPGGLIGRFRRVLAGVEKLITFFGPDMAILAAGRRAIFFMALQAVLMKCPLQTGFLEMKKIDILFEGGKIFCAEPFGRMAIPAGNGICLAAAGMTPLTYGINHRRTQGVMMADCAFVVFD